MKLASRASAGALGVLLVTAASAGPVVIDDEQKAAMAVATALSVAEQVQTYRIYFMQPIIRFTNRALQAVNSATTPEALKLLPAGVTVPCEVSGTVTARMAPRQPRMLKVEWRDCRFLQSGYPLSLDGPGEVLLLSDSFTPTAVAAIRFGNKKTDLVQTRELNFPDQASVEVHRRNLRLTGHIPLIENVPPGTEATFAYLFTGFIDDTFHNTFPDSGRPPVTYNYNYSLENVAYTGLRKIEENWADDYEELRIPFGKLTVRSNLPAPYLSSVESHDYAGLRVSYRYFTAADFTREITIDGRINKVFNPAFGAGCVSGEYSFKTRTPLGYPLFSGQQFKTGDLTVNGSARARFYSSENVPAGLPVPVNGILLNLEVRKVGAFNYDVAILPDTLREVGLCM